MPNSRYYSSIAAVTALQVTAAPSDATIQVASSIGFPNSFPFTLSLDYGSANEELVDVTGGGPSIFNVTRAVDNTSASTHNAGAVVRHVSSARDFTDSRTHESSTTGVHGISGAFVDTTSVQTLTNKTLTSAVLNNGTLNGTFTGTPTFSGAVTLSGGGSLGGTFTGSPTLSGGVTLSGTPIISNGAALSGTLSGAPDFSGNFTASGTPVFNNQVLAKRTFATGATFRASVTGDGVDRFYVQADGKHFWGDGTAAVDTNLYRSAANVLTTDDSFTVAGTLTVPIIAGNVSFTGSPTFAPTTATDGSVITGTVANGWSLNSAGARKAGGVTTIRVNVERSGGNIVASSSGNIPDTVIGTLAAGWRPIDGTMVTNYDMSGIAAGSVSIGNDGVVTIKSLFANNTIGLADTVNFSLTWANST